MDTRHLGGEQIRSLTKQGIWYEDDAIERFIDFTMCYENYVQESLSPERWESIKKFNHKSDADWEDYADRIRRFKYVGDRNILTPPWADGPYIEFCTTPLIRFKFATEAAFQKVRIYIERSGWRTGDKS
ncbi:MAG: hypothetical protein H7175_16070 [Burkholderiales bacterium]|nr:hypothetical protein [Anaerolineae bacterium]